MFEKGVTYVFRAKLVEFKNPSNADILWTEKCNNKIVKVTNGGYTGTITVDGVTYTIIKAWCMTVSNDKLEAFLKATNQENPNKEE
jgi:riboflavin synthase alpha subunit